MNMIPLWAQAAFWGGVAGSALLIGALIGLFAPIRPRIIAGVMAFGAGVLISALSFELILEAWRTDGAIPSVAGFLGGALLFTFGNIALARRGAKHRKRSGDQLKEAGTGGGALALGALLDGIPEAMVIGVSLLAGQGVGLVAVIAVFLSNIPEGLASATGMRRAGYATRSVLALWCAIVLASAFAAGLGCYLLTLDNTTSIAFVQALAAGAILTMIIDTMVPEAFAETHDFSGLIAVAGFLAAFVLSQSQGG